MLRIPDIICATLADYDFDNEKFSHEKFTPILENLIASNEKILTMQLNMLKDSNTALRRTFDNNKSATDLFPVVVE